MSAVSRRAVIAGFATGVATGITPTVMANPVEYEGPAERVNRLAQELSEALADWAGGSFRAIVEPDDPDRAGVWFQNTRNPFPTSASTMVDAWIEAGKRHLAFKATGRGGGHPCSEDACHLHDLWLTKERAGNSLLMALLEGGVA